MQLLQYGQAAFDAWQKKNNHVYSARALVEQERLLLRRAKATASAQLFLQKRSKRIVWDPTRPEHAVGKLMTWRRPVVASWARAPR